MLIYCWWRWWQCYLYIAANDFDNDVEEENELDYQQNILQLYLYCFLVERGRAYCIVDVVIPCNAPVLSANNLMYIPALCRFFDVDVCCLLQINCTAVLACPYQAQSV